MDTGSTYRSGTFDRGQSRSKNAGQRLPITSSERTHARKDTGTFPAFLPPPTHNTHMLLPHPSTSTYTVPNPFPLQVHLLLPTHNPTNNTITRSFSKSVKTSVTMVCPCPAPTLAVARLNPQTHRGALGNTCTCTHATLRTAGKSSRENVTFVYV